MSYYVEVIGVRTLRWHFPRVVSEVSFTGGLLAKIGPYYLRPTALAGFADDHVDVEYAEDVAPAEPWYMNTTRGIAFADGTKLGLPRNGTIIGAGLTVVKVESVASGTSRRAVWTFSANVGAVDYTMLDSLTVNGESGFGTATGDPTKIMIEYPSFVTNGDAWDVLTQPDGFSKILTIPESGTIIGGTPVTATQVQFLTGFLAEWTFDRAIDHITPIVFPNPDNLGLWEITRDDAVAQTIYTPTKTGMFTMTCENPAAGHPWSVGNVWTIGVAPSDRVVFADGQPIDPSQNGVLVA